MTTATLPRELRPPRVPADCPVSIVHLWRPDYGRHHLYEIHDHRGALVEVISGDDTTAEQRVHARYPWTSTANAPAFGVLHNVWPVYSGEINAKGYKYRANLEPWSEHAPVIVAMADRCEKFAAAVEAIRRVRIDGNGTHPLDGPRTALVYQRTRERAGDDVSEHLRRAMRAAERAGLVQDVSEDGLDTDTVKRYRATDSTPYTLGER